MCSGRGRGWHNYPSEHAMASKGLSPRAKAEEIKKPQEKKDMIRLKEKLEKEMNINLDNIGNWDYSTAWINKSTPLVWKLHLDIEEASEFAKEFGIEPMTSTVKPNNEKIQDDDIKEIQIKATKRWYGLDDSKFTGPLPVIPPEETNWQIVGIRKDDYVIGLSDKKYDTINDATEDVMDWAKKHPNGEIKSNDYIHIPDFLEDDYNYVKNIETYES